MAEPNPPSLLTSSQLEYEHLLSYFKYLVTLTSIVLGVVIAIGTYLFHSNMQDVRDDAKREATRVATVEANTAVAQAFDEKNINATILAAAEKKVGTITDKLIEQQLTSKLRPVQQRIVLMGQIAEDGSRMRLGFRAGLDDLDRAIKSTSDPDIARFGRGTLETISEDYDTRSQEDMKRAGLSGLPALQRAVSAELGPSAKTPNDLHDVLQIIQHDANLNVVAIAFLIFRDLTGVHAKMFDFDSITSWCSRNQGKC